MDKEELNNSLILAAKNGNFEMVQKYLNSGADINCYNGALLQYAIRGRLDIFKYLLENDADINEHIVADSIFNGNNEKTKYLIKHGRISQESINHGLCACVKTQNIEMLKYLLDSGADIHAFDGEPIIKSASNDNMQIFNFLISKGADIHAQDDSAMITAANNGIYQKLKYLLDNNADVHARNEKALRNAIAGCHSDCVRLLLEYGANIDVCDKEVIGECIQNGMNEVDMEKSVNTLNILLEYGLDINIIADFLKDRYEFHIFKLLFKHGADFSKLFT